MVYGRRKRRVDTLSFTVFNKHMLTQKDIDEVEELIRTTVKEEISHLSTKDEFYGKMDKVMGELKGIREDFKVMTNKVYKNHEPRIQKVEKKLHIQTPA